jgi:hypothetical protein
MAEQVSRQELELLLEEKTAHIKNRIDALQAEVTSVGQLLHRTAEERPLVLLGGAIAAGLLAGLLFGGRRKKRDPFRSGTAQRELIDRYVDALTDHARAAVSAGSDVGEAVETALADRVPLILYRAPSEGRGRGVLSSILDIVLTTATSLAATMASSYLTASFSEQHPRAHEEYGPQAESGADSASSRISGSAY